MSRIRIMALCAVLLVGIAAPAAATTAVHMSDEDLVANADLILVGECLEVESTWVGRDLVTLATVQVSEALKGEMGETVTVVLPGGVDASGPVPVAVTWPGAPSLAPGEAAVLFLNAYSQVQDGYAVAGFSQGLFNVVEGPAQVEASRNLSSMTLRVGGADRPGQVRSERLETFMTHVRSLLAGEEVER